MSTIFFQKIKNKEQVENLTKNYIKLILKMLMMFVNSNNKRISISILSLFLLSVTILTIIDSLQLIYY